MPFSQLSAISQDSASTSEDFRQVSQQTWSPPQDPWQDSSAVFITSTEVRSLLCFGPTSPPFWRRGQWSPSLWPRFLIGSIPTSWCPRKEGTLLPVSILTLRLFLLFALEGRAYSYSLLLFGLALSPCAFMKVVEATLARRACISATILTTYLGSLARSVDRKAYGSTRTRA